jgi:hypothetical protein
MHGRSTTTALRCYCSVAAGLTRISYWSVRLQCIGLRGDFLGNYPHLLTHVSLIRSAMFLDLALTKQQPHEIVQAMMEDLPNRQLQEVKIEPK